MATDENASLNSTAKKKITEIRRLQGLVDTMDKDDDKLRFDVSHIKEKLVVKNKEYQLLQIDLALKIGAWNDLQDKLLAHEALINRTNRPKGGLDCNYREVNTGHYGIGFDKAIDGIYQLDKSDKPKLLIPGVGNIDVSYGDKHNPRNEVSTEEYIDEFFSKEVPPGKRWYTHGNEHHGYD